MASLRTRRGGPEAEASDRVPADRDDATGRGGGAARMTERLIPIICLIGGLLLIGSELLDTFTIENPEGEAVALVGAADRHLFALGLLGLLGIAATATAVLAGSRPAARMAAVAGLAALALFAIVDLPDAGTSDLLLDPSEEYTEGTTVAAGGFWTSLAGATLLTIGGILLATLTPDQLRHTLPTRGNDQT